MLCFNSFVLPVAGIAIIVRSLNILGLQYWLTLPILHYLSQYDTNRGFTSDIVSDIVCIDTPIDTDTGTKQDNGEITTQ